MNTINLHNIKHIELDQAKIGVGKRYTIRTKDVTGAITEIYMFVPLDVEIIIKKKDDQTGINK